MPDASGTTRSIVGVMTGTSLDGLDGVLARVTGSALDMRISVERHAALPFGPLEQSLRDAAGQRALPAGAFARLGRDLGALHVDLIGTLLRGHEPIDCIALHGQTIFHEPPLSWQIVNPHIIAQRFDVPVVSDLRQADLAAGGEGAPLTPITDWVMFRHAERRRAVINLGGFCNVTVLPAGLAPAALEHVDGFDVCACNHVLDEVARRCLGAPYDTGGRAAQSGSADDSLRSSLLERLTGQRRENRSLGTADALHEWVAAHEHAVPPADLAASGAAAIADCIAAAIERLDVEEAIVAGGGCRNAALLDRIGRRAGLPVITSDDLGVPVAAREAAAIAVLGALCADGVPITLARVTGRTGPTAVAGSWCLPQGLAIISPHALGSAP
jgi:1,6-anhydro-N-acetylmuramate kinase